MRLEDLILQSAFSQEDCTAAAVHEASFSRSQQRAIENQKYIRFFNLQVVSRETRCSLSFSRIVEISPRMEEQASGKQIKAEGQNLGYGMSSHV